MQTDVYMNFLTVMLIISVINKLWPFAEKLVELTTLQ